MRQGRAIKLGYFVTVTSSSHFADALPLSLLACLELLPRASQPPMTFTSPQTCMACSFVIRCARYSFFPQMHCTAPRPVSPPLQKKTFQIRQVRLRRAFQSYLTFNRISAVPAPLAVAVIVKVHTAADHSGNRDTQTRATSPAVKYSAYGHGYATLKRPSLCLLKGSRRGPSQLVIPSRRFLRDVHRLRLRSSFRVQWVSSNVGGMGRRSTWSAHRRSCRH